mgnify:FL=1
MITVHNENELKAVLKNSATEFVVDDFAVETAVKIFCNSELLESIKANAFDNLSLAAIKPIIEQAAGFTSEKVTITVCSDVVQCVALLMKNVAEATFDNDTKKVAAVLK